MLALLVRLLSISDIFPLNHSYRLTAQLYFRWYDIWTGIYIDRRMKIVYWGFLPMVGIRFYISGVDRRRREPENSKGDNI